ncbi:MAG TPA: thiamine pyrophosphate-binding protein [Acidimicrobiales bacterium]|nr:thiamine pyrophosphate-binding protein [Acidimicrobiales bacterium]
MTERSGGALLVEGLRRWDVDVVFGLPGVQLDGLFEGLATEPAIRVIHTRHEQTAAYMADGYARVTGRVGVCAIVPGPGLLNAGAALATAYACGSRVLCIVGQVPNADLGRGRGVLHEIPDQQAVLRGLIARSEHATRPEDVPSVVDRAFAALLGNERPRPYAIELGWDTMLRAADVTWPARPSVVEPKQPDTALVQAAAERLAHASNPVILVGGGALGAGDALVALAEHLGAPIVMTTEGKGAVPASHPLALPLLAVPPLFEDVDVLLIVGSRAHLSRGPLPVPPNVEVIRVDVDPGELDQSVKPSIAIESDAGAAARALLDAIDPAELPARDVDARSEAIHDLGRRLQEGMAARFPDLARCCEAIRAALPADGVLVDEMTQVGYFARNGYPAEAPGTYIGSGYQGTLGFGFPTALGAKVGSGDRPVVSISGDGGFLYGVGDLATMAQHDIAVVAVVFRDDAFGNVLRMQQESTGHEIASRLRNPDLVKLADSFGVAGHRVDDLRDLRSTLDRAIDADEPAVIDVPIGPQPDLWRLLTLQERLT